MPIYEYVCHNCGNEFEWLQGWSDETPACTECASDSVTRRLSPPAIHFKGSGWYITDSKNGKGKNGTNGVAGSNGASKNGNDAGSSADSSEERKSKESSNEPNSSAKSESSDSTNAEKATSKAGTAK